MNCKSSEFHDLPDASLQIDGREFLVRVSYMEIYNEEINDLLAPENRKLQVHENLEVLFDLQKFMFNKPFV